MGERYRGVAYATVEDFNTSDQPGWVKVPLNDPSFRLGARWFVRTMVGCVTGRLTEGVHSVVEHPDGTITVSPSLVMHQGWHGWLRRGEFEVLDYGGTP